jgi:hypothetical protein
VAAAENEGELDRALQELDEAFLRATGEPARRLHGRAYAGRTLLYLDCRRDVEVSLGPGLIDRIRAPLSLIGASARWFTFEIARRYRLAFDEIFDRIAAETGQGVLELQRFWREVVPLFPQAGGIVGEVGRELSRRWIEILALDDRPRIERSSSELRAAVDDAFAAPHAGWPSARHHSPDLMIAAESVEHVSRGEYLVVLGEVHAALAALTNPFMMELHPDPESLLARREAELPDTGIAPVWSKARTRADFYSASRHDLDLLSGRTRSWRAPERTLRVADLLVERREGRLSVVSRDGAHRFDIIAFADHHLTAAAHARFDPIGPMAHRPRVSIDAFVMSRESWQFDGTAFEFAREKDPYLRFQGARRWAAKAALPRFSFYRVPEEPKPAFLDLFSPTYVEMFCKRLRATASLEVSEMIPDLSRLWLLDAEGMRYTSELRMTITDDRPFAEPSR